MQGCKEPRMIIILNQQATSEQIAALQAKLQRNQLTGHLIEGAERKILAVVGSFSGDARELSLMPGVLELVRVGKPYKLASKEAAGKTVVTVGTVNQVQIGGPQLVTVAGPCSVETKESIFEAAREVIAAGASLFRAGAYKPRTSPYAFQGLGEDGLKLLAEVRDELGIPVVTEVVSPGHVEMVSQYVDMLQIGARNMQNFELLKAVAQSNKPVLLKRGLAATIEEFLMSAEYILAGGNKVVLCERGIRTFEPSTRNTLDLSSVPVIRALSHLPILVDPSHGTGHRGYVPSMALAGIACGADGLMIEVHPNPPEAWSDGPQSLYPEQFRKVMRDLAVIAPVVGRHLPYPRFGQMSQASKGAKGEFKATAPDAPLVVAYQGEPGAYSESAVKHFFGVASVASPTGTFAGTFDRVTQGEVPFAVLPIENSLGGTIHQNYDLLLEHENLQIRGEILLRIQHNLIVNPGVQLSDIRRVYAHPQAAAQCEDYIRRSCQVTPDQKIWEVINLNDTAGSVRYLKDHQLKDAAAIASLQAAENLEMTVLQTGIESHPRNFTRFLVLSLDDSPIEAADKASLVFATDHSPGALFSALEILARHSINLLKLESRPIPGKPWEYMFYVDVQIPKEPLLLANAEGLLTEKCPFFRSLGRYRAAQPLWDDQPAEGSAKQ